MRRQRPGHRILSFHHRGLLLLAAVGTVAGRLLWKRRRRERQAAPQSALPRSVRPWAGRRRFFE